MPVSPTLSRHLYQIIVAAFMLIPLTGAAQEHTGETENVTTINLLNPGISYEMPLSSKQSVKLTGMMNVLFSTVISSNYSHTDVYLDPALEAGYRYYYNFKKRMNAGKRTEKNSGNYLSGYGQVIYSKMPIGSSYFEETQRRAVGVLGICWGMQRNYRGHFSLDLNLGVQYRTAKSSFPGANNPIEEAQRGEFLPAAGLTLGLWLN